LKLLIVLGLLFLRPALLAAEITAVFNSPAEVPVTSAGYIATGNTIAFTLNHAPATGATLTVVNNTATGFISGDFDNLPQGARVVLSFGGRTYPYIANYFGGTGNDLILEWENTRLLGWGFNGDGQLGQGREGEDAIPVPTPSAPEIVGGKAVVAMALGGYVGMASATDGTIFASGRGDQTGRSGPQEEGIPYPVDLSTALPNTPVVGMSAGFSHILVLGANGSMGAWGSNAHGQLNNGGTQSSAVPLALNKSGALAGKSVTAVTSGVFGNLVLCSDGSVVGWGQNGSGELGSGSMETPSAPVAVVNTGVLANKTVVSIASGRNHILALCSDGTLVSWGLNSSGQLGIGNTTSSSVPMLVSRTGVLAGKTVTAIAAGGDFSMALCSDSTLAAWGAGGEGQLGNGTPTGSANPVPVARTGVLAGKTIVSITAGQYHGMALCSDGVLAAWGYNGSKQLGSTIVGSNSLVPVAVSTSSLRAGERFIRAKSGPVSSSNFALAASSPLPVATTLEATLIADNAATLNARVNANGTSTNLSFEYGLTTVYGTSVAATPATATGINDTAVSRRITGLTPGTTYHYRVVCNGAAGTIASGDGTFTTSSAAALAGISLSQGTLSPAFSGNIANYDTTVNFEAAAIAVTPTVATAGATVQVNGQATASGSPSDPVNLAVGTNVITLLATAPDGQSSKEYRITVLRLPGTLAYPSAATVPVSVSNLFASGTLPAIQLDFVPPAGTTLTIVRNTGLQPIRGSFTNLVHGQAVRLTFGNTTYNFVANYYGGSGNDLVLVWANTRPVAWGYNSSGQLGNDSVTASTLPVAVVNSGELAGKTVTSLAVGYNHSLAVCSDGTVVGWGNADHGELGFGSFSSQKLVPTRMDQSGVLAGKTVVAVSAGMFHSLILCSDGTIASCGQNTYGELGDGTRGENRFAPVSVVMDRALAGKHVISVEAGETHSLALCSDGTMYAWGASFSGAVGVPEAGAYREPVAVDRSGVLAGKTVTKIAVGSGHNLALCSDGTLVAWGANTTGQLGNGNTTDALVPVAVNRSGVLAGKTIVKMAAGSLHSLVLCSDGTLAAWGANSGRLGDNSTTQRNVPVAVNRSGFLADKTVIDIAAGGSHSAAVCSDGTMATWSENFDGQLGTGNTTGRLVPGAVDKSIIGPTQNFTMVASKGQARCNLALLAPAPPLAQTKAASIVTATTATLAGSASGNGSAATLTMEYGETTAYGSSVVPSPASVGASGSVNVTANLTGLKAGTTYHFRMRAESASGTTYGSDMSFRIPGNNAFASSISTPQAFTPAFDREGTRFSLTVPFDTSTLPVTVIAEDPLAQILIANTRPGAGGTLNVNLTQGLTNIRIDLVAENGHDTRTYWIDVVRLPATFVYETGTEIWASSRRFDLPAVPANFELRYAPEPGTRLMVARSLGLDFPTGRFSNLAHGQTIILSHAGKSYRFTANYYGGSGNDVVLEWADTTIYGWGANNSGQLGAGGGSGQPLLLPRQVAGTPQGMTTFGLAAGYLHSLSLSADGTVSAWGSNTFGQLGDGTKASHDTPAPVKADGALAGKTVVAVAAGAFHSLALCSDGTVAGWGYNNHGQLGNASTVLATAPVAVDASGVLAGRQVVAISAGAYHSLALCSDGGVAAWGFNGTGALGDGTITSRSVPVLVQREDGQPMAAGAIGAGQYHNLMSDLSNGTAFAWGYNNRGQLGDGTTEQRTRAVPVNTSGTLSGQSVGLLAPGNHHGVVVMGIGTMAAWGEGRSGQLGNGSYTSSLVPVAVAKPGVLSGVTIESLVSGADHLLAQTNIGTLVSWGANSVGQLGNGGTAPANVPQNVSQATLEPGARFGTPAKGCCATHTLAIVARPAGAGTGALIVDAPGAANSAGVDSLAAWRTLYFDSPDNAADAGDNADPDRDGIVNLIEYAFAADPLKPSASVLPQPAIKDGHLVIEFIAPAEDMGVTYGASWTREPGSAPWQILADEGTGSHHLFRIPINGRAGFMRLLVTSP
jgi:alpha-tubulin suppressor-like RCC1 family protein